MEYVNITGSRRKKNGIPEFFFKGKIKINKSIPIDGDVLHKKEKNVIDGAAWGEVTRRVRVSPPTLVRERRVTIQSTDRDNVCRSEPTVRFL